MRRPILIPLPVPLEELKKLSFERQMDVILDAFEISWRKGLKPNVEEYSNLVDPEYQKRMLRELILLEKVCFNEVGNPGSPFDKSSLGTVESAQLETLNASLGIRFDSIDEIPSHFDRFAIKKLLGRGSHGVVYEAEDVEIRRKVAIKLASSTSGSDTTRAFATEAANASKVEHPGVVKILEVGNYRGINFMVSELIVGPSLSEFATSHDLDDSSCVRILADVAEVVSAAHHCGVIHRDLKPSNIMMELVDASLVNDETKSEAANSSLLDSYRVRILDFGIAKVLERTTRRTVQGDIVGTPQYMSPEQASGNSLNVNDRSDVFSMGVILYELLSGKLPFEGSEVAVISGIRDLKAPPIRSVRTDIPAALEVITHKCLERNPEHRYESAAALEQDLRKWLAGEKPNVLRYREAKRRAYATVATLAVCVLIGFVVLAGRNGWFHPAPNRVRLQAWVEHGRPESLLEWVANGSPGEMREDFKAIKDQPSLEEWRVRFANLFADTNLEQSDLKQIAFDFVEKIDQKHWSDVGKAVPNGLVGELEAIATNEQAPMRRQLLFGIVAERWTGIEETRGLTLLLQEAKSEDLKSVVQSTIKLANQNAEFKQWLSKEFDSTELTNENVLPSEDAARWRAKLGLIAMGLQDWERVDRLISKSVDPRPRNYFIYWFNQCDFAVSALMERFASDEDEWKSTAALACLSYKPPQKLTDKLRRDFTQQLMGAYANHNSAGVHRSARTLLLAWGLEEFVAEVDSSAQLRSDRNWYTTPFGTRMSIVRAPQSFWIGALPESAKKFPSGWKATLNYSFAVAEELVTEIQYSEFDPSKFQSPKDAPALGLNWYETVKFCDWLNRREGIEDRDSIEYWEDIPQLFTDSADGYRLLSAGEWECFFRAGTITSISLGENASTYLKDMLHEDLPNIDRRLHWNFGPVKTDNLVLNELEWTSTSFLAFGPKNAFSSTNTVNARNDDWVIYKGGFNVFSMMLNPHFLNGMMERDPSQDCRLSFRLARRIH